MCIYDEVYTGYVLIGWSISLRSSNNLKSFPGCSVVKNLPTNEEDLGSIPGLVRSPGEGNGNPIQYSCLGNPMDTGAWQAMVHGVAKDSDMT